MKVMFLSIMILFLGTNVQAQDSSSTKKILVAYFSYSGNTKVVADHITALTGGDMFRIETENSYPKEYKPCTEVAKKERDDNARPTLKTKVENMEQYDIVFVGCPSWWHTAPMAVLSFLESYDFAGKVVIPFCTHESKEDGAFAAIEKTTPDSKHRKGFDCFGSQVKNKRTEIAKWLKEIEIVK